MLPVTHWQNTGRLVGNREPRHERGHDAIQRYPTLDHLIPLSLGGSHTYENVKCACLRCNCKKSSDAANDQLLLIGR